MSGLEKVDPDHLRQGKVILQAGDLSGDRYG